MGTMTSGDVPGAWAAHLHSDCKDSPCLSRHPCIPTRIQPLLETYLGILLHFPHLIKKLFKRLYIFLLEVVAGNGMDLVFTADAIDA